MQQVGKNDHDEERNRMFRIHPAAKIGYISLNVSDIQSSLEFYQSILGFRKVRKQSIDRVLLSSDDDRTSSHLIELVAGESSKVKLRNLQKRRAIPFCNIASRKEKFGRCALLPK